ncbi:Coagulation factor 5/8 C-terminal domain [Fragilaria crotonensis]|nr:Coagulation factor 5/8 C-terminal domain [Fragilaria crotonensis]
MTNKRWTANSRVDEGVCASVRVQIKQRAVLTRDAFEAELQIQNSGLDMTNMTITLSITNRDSLRSANNLFVLSSPTLVGITSVDGNGTLAGSISGSASWLILALSDAAPIVPTYYNIGGKFEYYQDGVLTSTTMNPDTILVSPDPQLDLLYFHEYDIFGDDPFTPPIEPPVPYKLAVLVKNSGYGDAQGLRIMSGQPEIIDNEKGLLVDFKIISAELAGEPVQPSLDVNFGTVPARSSKVGVDFDFHPSRHFLQLQCHFHLQRTP